MEFVVDKEAKTVYITKEFDAELDLVWDAYTKQELLDQWYAPAPYGCRTKYMNFEVGGRRFYAMISPEGEERWCVKEFTSITPKTNFKMYSTFADKDENRELPGSEWDVNFSEQNHTTKVSITIYNESMTRLENVMDGFKEGMTLALKNLEELLATLSEKGAKNMKPAEASLPSDTEVLVKRSFDAPAKLVWRAYMEPDLMRRWCGSTPGWSMPVCEMDMRVGGRYRWLWRSDENGQEFGFNGEVLEVVPHARLVHTQIFDPGDMGVSMGGEPSIITVTFQEAGGMTNVATLIKYASKADRDEAFATGMAEGMEMNYKRLDEVLAEV